MATTARAAVDGGGETIALSGFSILEAANEGIFEDFQDTDEGDGVEFEPSYGASGDQSRAVWPVPTPTSSTTRSRPT